MSVDGLDRGGIRCPIETGGFEQEVHSILRDTHESGDEIWRRRAVLRCAAHRRFRVGEDEQSAIDRFERIANFRDLGGHTTRDGRLVARGRLFRSGHLAHASDADRSRLARLGLRRVFDFRTPDDVAIEGPDRLPESTESVRLPMADPAMGRGIRTLLAESDPDRIAELFGGGRAEAMMRRSAAGLVRERREPYGAFLRALVEPDALPALFHCSAGKDRAGWAGSIVLLCLDVPVEQVIEQYLRSNRAADEIIARTRAHGRDEWSDALQPLLEVRREYIEASFEAIEQDWGDFDRYLEDGLGITAAQRDAIRANLLDARHSG